MARPIGTIFKTVLQPANTGAMNANSFKDASRMTGRDGSHFRVCTWRITGHANDGRLETIELGGETEYFHPLRWDLYCGVMVPVPPPELLPLLSEDWQRPITAITYTQAAA